MLNHPAAFMLQTQVLQKNTPKTTFHPFVFGLIRCLRRHSATSGVRRKRQRYWRSSTSGLNRKWRHHQTTMERILSALICGLKIQPNMNVLRLEQCGRHFTDDPLSSNVICWYTTFVLFYIKFPRYAAGSIGPRFNINTISLCTEIPVIGWNGCEICFLYNRKSLYC